MFDPSQGYPRVVAYVRYLDPAAGVRWLVEVLRGVSLGAQQVSARR